MTKPHLKPELNHAQLVQREAVSKAQLLQEKHSPLVRHIFTADPSAHVFNGKIYVYPSHDIQSENEINDNGDQYAMRDYHVLSMEKIGGVVTDHGVALSLENVEWASEQLWAPDAAYKKGTYFFYFPARDKEGVFRIGVATSDKPAGPFKARPRPIEGAFSIDPAAFEDDDGKHYLYFGGLWGGQLEKWRKSYFDKNGKEPAKSEPALNAKVALLSDDMIEFAEVPKDVVVLDEYGEPLTAGDNHRRFFEASWVHKHNGIYYFSYSTGDTHKIAYATGTSPYGPFTYKGVILNPVLGWTNHHSITQFQDKWYLFYHDSSLSGGQSHLRCVKMAEIKHLKDGSIKTVTAYR